MPNTAPPTKPLAPLSTVALEVGTRLCRIHRMRYGATEFKMGPSLSAYSGGRFDARLGDESTLYLGDSVQAAAAETLFRDLVFNEGLAGYHVPLTKLQGRYLSIVEVQRPLRLVELTGPGGAAIGQPDSWLTTCDGQFYPATREWAERIREWDVEAAGFVWRSRWDLNRFSYVLYGSRCSADSLTKYGRSRRLYSIGGRATLESYLRPYGVSVSMAV